MILDLIPSEWNWDEINPGFTYTCVPKSESKLEQFQLDHPSIVVAYTRGQIYAVLRRHKNVKMIVYMSPDDDIHDTKSIPDITIDVPVVNWMQVRLPQKFALSGQVLDVNGRPFSKNSPRYCKINTVTDSGYETLLIPATPEYGAWMKIRVPEGINLSQITRNPEVRRAVLWAFGLFPETVKIMPRTGDIVLNSK